MEFFSQLQLQKVDSSILVLLVVPLALSFVIKGGSLLIALKDYYEFFCQHTDFYRNSTKRKNRSVFKRLPVPWPAEKTYFLLDQTPMRKLFASSPFLDPFALARSLHLTIWEVPPYKYGDTFRVGAKQIHKELSTKNLGAVTQTFEDVILENISKLKEMIGPEGSMIPVHTTFFRLAYCGNMRAIFGPDLPVDQTRVAVQHFASNIGALHAAQSLPMLPMSWKNMLHPGARRAVKARQALVSILIKWQEAGGISTSSGSWQNIMHVITDANVSFDDTTRWINLILFGFQGNTPEIPGWFLMHVLQSPKLWEAIKAEVATLPEGSLIGTNFKRTTPLLHSAIHETLRLSTATFAGRTTTAPVNLPGCEQTFPKGVSIRSMTRATAFNPSIWGPDPECFKGNRFLLDDSLFREELFFGGGVSACPGRFFAQAELELLMAHLIRDFSFDTATLEMHQRLPPEVKELELGPRVEPSFSCDIIDIDDTRLTGIYPGVADSNYRMESISGSLFPIQETACFVTPR